MRREEMVERAALAWHDSTCPEGSECRSRSLHGAPASTPVVSQLTAVLDAILPQVTTAAELEALHDKTWLSSAFSGGIHHGKAVRQVRHWRGYSFDTFGPLTVVWQPEAATP